VRLRFPLLDYSAALIVYNISAHTVGPFVKDGAFEEENGTDRLSRKGGK